MEQSPPPTMAPQRVVKEVSSVLLGPGGPALLLKMFGGGHCFRDPAFDVIGSHISFQLSSSPLYSAREFVLFIAMAPMARTVFATH